MGSEVKVTERCPCRSCKLDGCMVNRGPDFNQNLRDKLVSSRSENISVSFCLRAPGYGLTPWYVTSAAPYNRFMLNKIKSHQVFIHNRRSKGPKCHSNWRSGFYRKRNEVKHEDDITYINFIFCILHKHILRIFHKICAHFYVYYTTCIQVCNYWYYAKSLCM